MNGKRPHGLTAGRPPGKGLGSLQAGGPEWQPDPEPGSVGCGSVYPAKPVTPKPGPEIPEPRKELEKTSGLPAARALFLQLPGEGFRRGSLCEAAPQDPDSHRPPVSVYVPGVQGPSDKRRRPGSGDRGLWKHHQTFEV